MLRIYLTSFVLLIVAQRAEAELWTSGGKDFPIGQYAVETTADIQRLAADGFNLVHTYGFSTEPGTTPDDYLQAAQDAGVKVMFSIGDGAYIPAATAETIQHFSQYESLGWWYNSPEEIYYWEPAQFDPFKQRTAIIRANDPLDRPIFTYLQNGYTAQGLSNYTPYLDGIGAGAYANYVEKPRPWVRWAIEQEVQAIEMNGNPADQFPIGVLLMFPWPDGPTMTGADAYHDTYLSIVSGAKAIMVYGDYYRNAVDPGIYQSYKKAAQELNGSTRLGEAFLFGTPFQGALRANITSGPLKSQQFTDVLLDETQGNVIQYDSISQRVMAYNDHIYLSAVNSAQAAVGATFPGVRANNGNDDVDVLFESRTTTINNGAFSDGFSAIGVHNYRLPRDADLIIREENFNSVGDWNSRYGDGEVTINNGIATFQRGSEEYEYYDHTIEGGSVPEGGFIELKINAPTDVQFRLFVLHADYPTPALLADIPWQNGTGDWQTIRQQIAGEWLNTDDNIWLGIHGGESGDTFQVDSLGIYFRAISTQMGDTDFDDDVDLADLGALASSYGQTSGVYWRNGDFDGDGDVDLADLAVLASHYNTGSAQAMTDFQTLLAVPEPAASVTVAAMFAMLLHRVRDRVHRRYRQ
jgi:hypothetical protein